MTQGPDVKRPAGRRILTLLPMACDGVGPSQTCLQIAHGMQAAGHDAPVYALRRRVDPSKLDLRTIVPRSLSFLPFPAVSRLATGALERQFLATVRPGDIACLWPAASLSVHQALQARGITVVMEGINTCMASAKQILDAAYDAFGIAPAHGITQARIDEEAQKYFTASAIFAPSRAVEAALIGTPLQDAVLPTSYGVNTGRASPPRVYPAEGAALTFLFCGHACVRKGAHHLLDAWARMGGEHRLQFLGTFEPAIAERYSDILNSDRVECLGFVADPHPWFARADVFMMPSLEEGGPQVTYEAALHGTPIIASPMGAGRIGDRPGAMLIVDPRRTDDLLAAMEEMAARSDLRARLGQEARRRAFGFDWADVGARRGAMLQRAFAASANSRRDATQVRGALGFV